MCNRYPNCQHSGPVMDQYDDWVRHCETLLENRHCAYHQLGCKGCTFAPMQAVATSALLGVVPVRHNGGFQYRFTFTLEPQSLYEALQHNPLLLQHNRRAILRLLGAYINTRSNPDAT